MRSLHDYTERLPTCHASFPSRVGAAGSAPASSSALRASRLPRSAARWKAVSLQQWREG